MSKRRRHANRWAAANDQHDDGGQSVGPEDVALWSRRCLIPLVRFLARQAAQADFEKAANGNKPSKEERR